MTADADLEAEYQIALDRRPFCAMRRLMTLGVPLRSFVLTVPALARVDVSRDLYVPDPAGRPAYIVPVRVYDPATPEAIDPTDVITNGLIVDLIALYDPDQWALRRGTAEWLGAIEPQYLDPDPVPIWRSPLAWLRAGCEGLVPLSRDRMDQYRLLSVLREISAEDEAHAAELRGIIARPFRGPRAIVTRHGDARHAA